MLATVIGLTGCFAEYDDPPVYAAPGHWIYGGVEVCSDTGDCRYINDVRYYYGPNGEVFYYDEDYGAWIGPGAYYINGGWIHGYPHGYYEHYRGFYYHGSHWGNSYRGGGGYRGHGGGHRR
jgi:hypothetical protein